ncbi:3334_t:CDS:2, partial [Cetraspora pellucida]
GFVDGEGCFSISFSLRSKMKHGFEVRPSFSLAQRKDKNRLNNTVLVEIQNFFQVGIIPYFEVNMLRTSKKMDFEKFKKICLIIKSNHHLAMSGAKEIIDLAFEMNVSGKRKYKKEFLLKLLDKVGDCEAWTPVRAESKGERPLLLAENSNLLVYSQKNSVWYRNPTVSVKAKGCLTVRLTSRTDAKAGLSDPAVLSDHIDGSVWHLDVDSSHPGGEEATKGWAVRPLKRSALSTQGPEWTDHWCTNKEITQLKTIEEVDVVIPVPIPNTEVKHLCDENTLYGEDSSLPVLFGKQGSAGQRAVINKGSQVASDVPYYFNKLRQDYLNIQEKMDEERLGSLIKESNVHLEKVKGDIETIKDNKMENDDEFEVINKELTEKERYKEELEKLIHE